MTNAPSLRESLARAGVVVVRGAFDAARMSELSLALDAVAYAPDVRGGVWKYLDDEARDRGEKILSRVERFVQHDERLAAVVRDDLAGFAARALGEPVVLFKEKANLKLPGSSGFLAHQDAQAGWGVYAPLHLTAMLSIDRTTRENGCLEIESTAERRTGLAGPEWQPLDDTELSFEFVETEPGDVVIFDSFVVHRSAPNRTTAPRRVIYATYNAARFGDAYDRYFADKRSAYPPEAERASGDVYRYRV